MHQPERGGDPPVRDLAAPPTSPIADAPDHADAPGGLARLPFAAARRLALDRFTFAYVQDALRVAGGKPVAAARVAAVEVSNFRRLMRRYQIGIRAR